MDIVPIQICLVPFCALLACIVPCWGLSIGVYVSPGFVLRFCRLISSPSGSCPAEHYCPLGTTPAHSMCGGVYKRPWCLAMFSCPVGFVISNGTCVGCQAGYAALNASACDSCPAGFYCPPASLLVHAISCATSPSLYCPDLSVRPRKSSPMAIIP